MKAPDEILWENLEHEAAEKHPYGDKLCKTYYAIGLICYLSVQAANGDPWAIERIKRLTQPKEGV